MNNALVVSSSTSHSTNHVLVTSCTDYEVETWHTYTTTCISIFPKCGKSFEYTVLCICFKWECIFSSTLLNVYSRYSCTEVLFIWRRSHCILDSVHQMLWTQLHSVHTLSTIFVVCWSMVNEFHIHNQIGTMKRMHTSSLNRWSKHDNYEIHISTMLSIEIYFLGSCDWCWCCRSIHTWTKKLGLRQSDDCKVSALQSLFRVVSSIVFDIQHRNESSMHENK